MRLNWNNLSSELGHKKVSSLEAKVRSFSEKVARKVRVDHLLYHYPTSPPPRAGSERLSTLDSKPLAEAARNAAAAEANGEERSGNEEHVDTVRGDGVAAGSGLNSFVNSFRRYDARSDRGYLNRMNRFDFSVCIYLQYILVYVLICAVVSYTVI